ncbi:MAG: hypothetical protein ACM3ZQ_02680 [Bacillota bacterium]
MSKWGIKPSYKVDLACYCNLFFENPRGLELHAEAHEKLIHIFTSRPDLIHFAKDILNQGILIGCSTAAMVTLVNYDGYDIDEICRIFDDPSMNGLVKQYLIEQQAPPQLFDMFIQLSPKLSEMLRHVHGSGFPEYWRDTCLPELKARSSELELLSEQYPVIGEVNKLLGFEKVQDSRVVVNLCKFVAPYGIGLKEGFVADVSWKLETMVDVAVHEYIHAPFSRDRIRQMTQDLWKDPLVQEAKSRLPASSGYHLPENFVEENFVEGTHIYLSELLGVESDPLRYFIKHDSGSHVLSVILYDALKRGYRQDANNIQEVVERLITEGKLAPGNIRREYEAIYAAAGLAKEHPYQR